MKIKKPLFNHTSASCIFFRGSFDKESTELSSDWFSYLCVDCMNEYANRWGVELI